MAAFLSGDCATRLRREVMPRRRSAAESLGVINGSTMQKTTAKHWLALLGAIILEVCGSTVMKLSQSWTFAHGALLGLCLMWLAIGISYYLLAVATTGVPVGVAYAFWEGLGLTFVTVAGILFLAEPLTFRRALGLICVLLGAWLVHKGTSSGRSGAHG